MSTFSTAARSVFTSESVTEGHPDKVCDQISDSVLDAILAQDPMGRVACETAATKDLIVLIGEITTTATIDFENIARNTLREIGYIDRSFGIDSGTCRVKVAISEQSPEISHGVGSALETPGWEQGSVRPHRRRRPGHDDRLRLQRDPGAHADADCVIASNHAAALGNAKIR